MHFTYDPQYIYAALKAYVTLSKRFKRTQSSISLEHIKVQNFKSFKSLDISLDKFNVVIGANASGKSNFAQVFKFLNDIALDGLDSAISQQGGMEYLLNFTSRGASLSYEITFNVQPLDRIFFIGRRIRRNVIATKVVYRFEIQPEPNSEFKIIDDEWKFSIDMLDGGKRLPPLEIAIKKESGGLKVHIGAIQNDEQQKEMTRFKEHIEEIFSNESQEPQLLSLEHPLISRYIITEIGHFCSEIEVYDFDPKLAKLSVQIRGTKELDPGGENLAIAMKNVMEDADNQSMFSNIIADVLPFVHSVSTEKLLDNSIILMQEESYFKDKRIPATLISDGTINVTALICALYFQDNPLAIIEEPERNIHPSLVARIVNMIKDASDKKQIIVTTHSTEMIRYADIENILLIRRNKAGNSEIIKPSNQADVKEFLKNGIDIREMYVQNMLDG